jgi:hypothetical protein
MVLARECLALEDKPQIELQPWSSACACDTFVACNMLGFQTKYIHSIVASNVSRRRDYAVICAFMGRRCAALGKG